MSKQKNDIAYLNYLLDSAGGAFFTVDFIKANGEFRSLTGRNHVTVGVKGEDACETAKKALESFNNNPNNSHLRRVFDVNKVDEKTKVRGQWRMINLRTVQRIRVNGLDYVFEGDAT